MRQETDSGFKIGDIIARDDVPFLQYRITGESAEWRAWTTERTIPMPGTIKTGMVFKDDTRWVIVKRVAPDSEDDKQ